MHNALFAVFLVLTASRAEAIQYLNFDINSDYGHPGTYSPTDTGFPGYNGALLPSGPGQTSALLAFPTNGIYGTGVTLVTLSGSSLSSIDRGPFDVVSDKLYRDFAVIPVSNEPMGIQIAGLLPRYPYAVTFHAYDADPRVQAGSSTVTFTNTTGEFQSGALSGTVTYGGGFAAHSSYKVTLSTFSSSTGVLNFSAAGSGTQPFAILNGLNMEATLVFQPVVRSPEAPLTAHTTTSITQLHVVTNGGAIDSTKPTIVLTHGWNSNPEDTFGSFSSSDPTLAQSLANGGFDANIVEWDWSGSTGAGTNQNLGLARSRTMNQGRGLGAALSQSLGNSYGQSLHFIGHSLGALVNAQAIDYLHDVAGMDSSNTQIQDTLFDEAELANAIPSAGQAGQYLLVPISRQAPAQVDAGYTSAMPKRARWVDNYISAVGSVHEGAANVVLTNMNWGAPDFYSELHKFHSYPVSWYRDSVGATNVQMGHPFSLEADGIASAPTTGSYFVQADPNGNPLNLASITSGQAQSYLDSRNVRIIRKTVTVTAENLSSPIQVVGSVTYFSPFLDVLGILLRPHSPAYAWIPLSVPADADFISFDFQFNDVQPTDFLSVGINDEQLFTIEGQFVASGTLHNSGLIDVSNYDGQNVEVFVGYNNGGVLGGQIAFQNITFSSIPEPTSLAVIGMAGTLLMFRSKRR
jgi:pimeloyl-ACP methyl ester carboxylesterase